MRWGACLLTPQRAVECEAGARVDEAKATACPVAVRRILVVVRWAGRSPGPRRGRHDMSDVPPPDDTQSRDLAAAGARSARHDRMIELLVTVLLAIATVATAWSSYQSARWSGVQTINFSRANAARVESSAQSTLAGQQTQLDVATFIAWTGAYAANDTTLSDFYFKRFRAEFKPAVDAWVATKPLKNRAAPLTPFAMPQYHLAAQDKARALARTAATATAEAKVDNQRSDNYVLAVVLFASALFFAGISTKLDDVRSRITIVALGYTLFFGTLIWLATFPVSVSV
jgi:hypothetical protein